MKRFGRFFTALCEDESCVFNIARHPHKKPMVWQIVLFGRMFVWETKEWEREQKRMARAVQKFAFTPSPLVKKL